MLEQNKDDATEKECLINVTSELQVIKNNTSLQITIPKNWREVHEVEVGDWIEVALIKIVKKGGAKKK